MSYNQAELRKQVAEILRRPENKECADCTERLPKWAVVNHGIFVCLNCSGQHRNIGAHISKVKSTSLDDWEPEEVAFMAKMGNAKANSVLLANLPPGVTKPSSTDDRGRERWIKQKYVQRKWVGQPGQTMSHDQAPSIARPQTQSTSQLQSQQNLQPQYQQQKVSQQQQQPAQVSPMFQSFTQSSQTTTPSFSPSPNSWNQFPPSTSSYQAQNTNPPKASYQSQVQPNPFFNSQQSTQPVNQWNTTSYSQPQRQQQQQPYPQTQQTQFQPPGLLVDFNGPAKPQPRPIDPNTKNQLMSCFGGGGFSNMGPGTRGMSGNGW